MTFGDGTVRRTNNQISQDLQSFRGFPDLSANVLAFASRDRLLEVGAEHERSLPLLVSGLVLLIARTAPSWLLEGRKEASAPEGAVVCIDRIVGGMADLAETTKVEFTVEVACDVLVGLIRV